MLSKTVPVQRLLLLVLLLTAAGCAAARSPEADPGTAATAPATSAPAAKEEPAAEPPARVFSSASEEQKRFAEQIRREGPQPPDGVWLLDEAGRKYFVTEVPRYEGHYRWLDEEQTRIRLREGPFIVESYDDEVFRLRIYSVDALDDGTAPAARPVVDAAAVAATYRFEAATGDALRFEPFDRGLPRSGQWRNGLALADMNGDGHLDIVHGPARKGRPEPAIWLGDGSGTWRPWAAARFEAAPYDYGDVAVADFDGDGHLDLALAVHLRGLVVLVGDGQGQFRRWDKGLPLRASEAEATEFSSRALSVADWDGDGRPDLVALGEGGALALSPDARGRRGFIPGGEGLRVFRNEGDGSWTAAEVAETRNWGSALAVADLNGDGRPDVLMGTSRQGFRELLLLSGEDGRPTAAELPTLRPRATVGGVATGDFGGGSGHDVAVAYIAREAKSWRTGIDLSLRQPDGSWERRTLWNEEGRNQLRTLTAADLDGDGRLDLVAGGDEGRILLFLQGEQGEWRREESAELTPHEGCTAFSVNVADLDGRSGADLVVGFAGEPGMSGGMIPEPSTCPSSGAIRVWRAASVPRG